jgi:hypothetical protein
MNNLTLNDWNPTLTVFGNSELNVKIKWFVSSLFTPLPFVSRFAAVAPVSRSISSSVSAGDTS